MRLLSFPRGVAISTLISLATADKIFQSSSVSTCQANSNITASLLDITFTPNNQTLVVNLVGEAFVTGNVTFKVQAAAYGYVFLTETIDPQVQIGMDVQYNNISTNFIGRIPGIAYEIPDLDATVTVNIYSTTAPTVSIGCVLLKISNGKTVDIIGIRWATAAVAALGLFTSLLIGGLGHTNAAAHVAMYAFSLFSYFQSLALIGLCAVPLPPIVMSWTQDFVWSLGIIRVGFLQHMASWYQLATGGTPTTVFNTLSTKSVEVLKRSLVGSSLLKRSQVPTTSGGEYLVKGITRVAFLEGIEPSNLFFTAITFYCIIIIFTLLVVVAFKHLSELVIRLGWVKSEHPIFDSFRNDWQVTLKGIIFRLMLIGIIPIAALCLWEFTVVDSAAEVVLAVLFLFGISVALALATFHVIRVAQRSTAEYKTPAYTLYSNPSVLQKWGPLYVPFRATAYYYIVPTLAYILIKCAFVGLGQSNGTIQAIALMVIEALALVGASVLTPWMDKSTNGIHIAIFVVNFLNAVFLLIFTNIFNGPGLLIGVVGIVFFFLNVIFAFVLLVIVLVVATIGVWNKNPEQRYGMVKDDRASFRHSRTGLAAQTELDDLGAVARGDGLHSLKNEREAYSAHDESESL